MSRVLFFGGNGHSAARLRPAREALARRDARGEATFDLLDVPYPGFEGRPRADGPEAFLSGVAAAAAVEDRALVYATGIGALVALTLRVEGRLGRGRVVLQGPVLWGAQRRWMPRLARAGLAGAIPLLMRSSAFQRRFARRHFVSSVSAEGAAAFFDGYRRCASTADLFRWIGPGWLRRVEAAAAGRPEALRGIEVWQGGLDRVVGPPEVLWTERALGVRWPERRFAGWGHYPMIDDPEGWVRAVAATVHGEPAVKMPG